MISGADFLVALLSPGLATPRPTSLRPPRCFQNNIRRLRLAYKRAQRTPSNPRARTLFPRYARVCKSDSAAHHLLRLPSGPPAAHTGRPEPHPRKWSPERRRNGRHAGPEEEAHKGVSMARLGAGGRGPAGRSPPRPAPEALPPPLQPLGEPEARHRARRGVPPHVRYLAAGRPGPPLAAAAAATPLPATPTSALAQRALLQ